MQNSTNSDFRHFPIVVPSSTPPHPKKDCNAAVSNFEIGIVKMQK